ncbi:MAG TPA: hypothetical protein DEO32_01155 [Ruminococcaceae bacterium]|nr:hypothetical protein [Oscillospiraceae bacterium]
MKKLIALALAMVMCVAAFAGCGSKEVKLSEVMNKINTEYKLDLKSIDDLNKYYQINNDDVKQFAAEINSDTNAPVEVVLVEAKDKDAAANVEKALQTRLNSIINMYGSYTPEKKAMAQACKVTNENNFVTLIVADDADKMLQTFNEAIK